MYNKVKLIVGIVSTFTPNEEQTIDRGVPVCSVMATAEDKEINDAVVACLRMRMPDDWKPAVLMSDQACSSRNSFLQVFPEIRWVWWVIQFCNDICLENQL
jgi:hypothetical protein